MKNESQRKLLLILGILALLALACSDLTVTNETSNLIRVVVTMPGESVSETALLDAGDSDFFVSDYEGTYTVTAVMDEAWRNKLKATRDELTLILLGNFDDLDQEEISRMTKQLGMINDLLDEELQPVSCSGSVKEDKSGYALIEIHLSGKGLMISCE